MKKKSAACVLTWCILPWFCAFSHCQVVAGSPNMSAHCRLAAAGGAHLMLGTSYRVASKLTVWRGRLARRICELALDGLWQAQTAERQLGTSSAKKQQNEVVSKCRSQSKNSSWLQTLQACHHNSPCGPPQAPSAGQPAGCWGHQSGARWRRLGQQSPPLHGTGLASHIGPTSRGVHAETHPQSQTTSLKPTLPAPTGLQVRSELTCKGHAEAWGPSSTRCAAGRSSSAADSL